MSDKFSMPDTNSENRPSSQIDIYSDAVKSNVNDELLGELNLGLGNYSEAEFWQQVESFHQGSYADTAFSRRLQERAIDEAKRQMALEGWQFYDENREKVVEKKGWRDLDEEERAKEDRRRYLERRGDEIWSRLNRDERYEAIVELTGFGDDWTPPQWRMMMMRHEGSRSKEGRLIDNIFGRVKEVKDSTSELAKQRLNR